ncbi:hypothetical protein HaLaN_25305 [Haematococcus lacustris]|uniref:Uncharacterized protein n=1 Tax=Haematococcus lacustris TaxID=44745 RepID=A0A699ZVV8_HAELA|nr:hypothetical protein HaLaN_25305 [Haematococcus lacustris]
MAPRPYAVAQLRVRLFFSRFLCGVCVGCGRQSSDVKPAEARSMSSPLPDCSYREPQAVMDDRRGKVLMGTCGWSDASASKDGEDGRRAACIETNAQASKDQQVVLARALIYCNHGCHGQQPLPWDALLAETQ